MGTTVGGSGWPCIEDSRHLGWLPGVSGPLGPGLLGVSESAVTLAGMVPPPAQTPVDRTPALTAEYADTRGIVAPVRFREQVRYARYPPPESLAGLIAWFWRVEWDLPGQVMHRQQVVSHPAVHISVGTAPPPGQDPPPGPYPLGAMLNGVDTAVSTRALSGHGWNLAAKTTTGGFGAWVDNVRALNGTHQRLGDVLPIDGDALARRCARAEPSQAVAWIAEALHTALEPREPARIATAREVAQVAQAAETDRSIRRLDQLAALAGVTPRTLQRLFASCAGVSPTYVIRRFRLLDAAELVREGQPVEWAKVAHDLGYADQAHLTRDFTGVLGRSPGMYARECAMRGPRAGTGQPRPMSTAGFEKRNVS